MQKFLSRTQSDQLDFAEFCQLFEQTDGASLISVSALANYGKSISIRKRVDNATFQVRYRDFERWLRTEEDS